MFLLNRLLYSGFVLLVVVGCGPAGPTIAPVSGTVTKAGKPISGASITFYPSAGRPSYGTSTASGTYTLQYEGTTEGAVVGEHSVRISYGSSEPTSEGAPTDRSAASRVGVDMKLPNQVEVKQGNNVIDLEVP